MNEFEELAARIREFADARNWHKFHTPKNLSMALVGEAGELVAEFQWMTQEESERSMLTAEQVEAIRLEMADVQIYLIRLADVLEIDLPDAVRAKMKINEGRF